MPSEVDDQIGALARRDQQRGHRHWRAQQSALGSDLCERQRPAAVVVDEAQVVEARLRAVDDPQPVAARLDVDERPDLGVDDRDVAEELRHPLRVICGDPLRWVEHAAVGVERLVLQHQRDLVPTSGEPERIVRLACVLVVTDDVSAGQAGVDVRTRVAERMVVIPHHRRTLLVVVRERVGDVVRTPLAAVGEPLQRCTVELRQVLTPMQVRDHRRGLSRQHCAHDGGIVGQERVAELVAPIDRHGGLDQVVRAGS